MCNNVKGHYVHINRIFKMVKHLQNAQVWRKCKQFTKITHAQNKTLI